MSGEERDENEPSRAADPTNHIGASDNNTSASVAGTQSKLKQDEEAAATLATPSSLEPVESDTPRQAMEEPSRPQLSATAAPCKRCGRRTRMASGECPSCQNGTTTDGSGKQYQFVKD